MQRANEIRMVPRHHRRRWKRILHIEKPIICSVVAVKQTPIHNLQHVHNEKKHFIIILFTIHSSVNVSQVLSIIHGNEKKPKNPSSKTHNHFDMRVY